MPIYTGQCDMYIAWELDSYTGTLTIKGIGDMYNEDAIFLKSIWYKYADLITNVVIENNVTSIANWAFYKLEHLEEVIIPNTVTCIGEGAFSSCTSLKHITIPNSVNVIENEAFADCENLTSVTFSEGPNSCTIRNFVFQNCSNLTSINITPNTLIYKTAFAGCPKLNII